MEKLIPFVFEGMKNVVNPLTPEDAYRRAFIYGVHFALKRGAKGTF